LFAGQKKRAEGALAAAEQNEAYQDFRGAAILFEEGGKLDNAFANYIASSEQQKEVATRRLFSAESNKKKGAGYVTACLRDAAKAYDIAAHSSQDALRTLPAAQEGLDHSLRQKIRDSIAKSWHMNGDIQIKLFMQDIAIYKKLRARLQSSSIGEIGKEQLQKRKDELLGKRQEQTSKALIAFYNAREFCDDPEKRALLEERIKKYEERQNKGFNTPA